MKINRFLFSRQLQWVMNAVDNNLSATAGDLYNSKLHAQLWAAINDEINLTECDIYRYTFKIGYDSNTNLFLGFSWCLVTTLIWLLTRLVKMAASGHSIISFTTESWKGLFSSLAELSGILPSSQV